MNYVQIENDFRADTGDSTKKCPRNSIFKCMAQLTQIHIPPESRKTQFSSQFENWKTDKHLYCT